MNVYIYICIWELIETYPTLWYKMKLDFYSPMFPSKKASILNTAKALVLLWSHHKVHRRFFFNLSGSPTMHCIPKATENSQAIFLSDSSRISMGSPRWSNKSKSVSYSKKIAWPGAQISGVYMGTNVPFLTSTFFKITHTFRSHPARREINFCIYIVSSVSFARLWS